MQLCTKLLGLDWGDTSKNLMSTTSSKQNQKTIKGRVRNGNYYTYDMDYLEVQKWKDLREHCTNIGEMQIPASTGTELAQV
jgi:hypothetical protein